MRIGLFVIRSKSVQANTKDFNRVHLSCAYRARKFDYLWWANLILATQAQFGQ